MGARATDEEVPLGAWSPLRHSLFRALWLAAVASNLGTSMHDVGAAWLMTSLSGSPLLVALLQTASNLAFFLLALPAGALADLVDRRKVLIFSQSWMLAAAAGLGLVTVAHLATPWVLVSFTFLLGLGSALNGPAWQAITPELVSRAEMPRAVALGSVAFNLARAVGPALGGLVVAAAGSGAVFLLNAASFLGVILVLRRWRRDLAESLLPAERLGGAVKAGLRYVAHSASLRAVLVRTIAFMLCASALWAVLPLLARRELGLSSVGYGVLLGFLGAGAVSGASLLPGLQQRYSIGRVLAAATLLFAAAEATLAVSRLLVAACLAMFCCGISWLSILTSFNASAQAAGPSWVRARALSVYLLVWSAGMTAGSVFWGAVAAHWSIAAALLGSAAALALQIPLTRRHRVSPTGEADLSPSGHWPPLCVAEEPAPDSGPVLVAIEYRIDPAQATEFARAMRDVRTIRRRDGALRWQLFVDTADPEHYRESYIVESWAEHLRQHERVTRADREVEQRAWSYHIGDTPPAVTHFIAQSLPKG